MRIVRSLAPIPLILVALAASARAADDTGVVTSATPAAAAAAAAPRARTATDGHTPLAGEAYDGEAFGEPIHVDARDRSSVLALLIGDQVMEPGVAQLHHG